MMIVRRMLVVFRTTKSLHGGCIYKRVDVMAHHLAELPPAWSSNFAICTLSQKLNT